MKIQYLKFTLFYILLPAFTFAQPGKILEILTNTQSESRDIFFSLKFIDAKTGMSVKDASISVPGIGEFMTDTAGLVMFDNQPDGNYPFQFSKKGYVSATYDFQVKKGTIYFNRYSVSPIAAANALRIVLDWNKMPTDLDIHLVKEHGFHISFLKTKVGDGSAQLDRDDKNGNGPETITINNVDKRTNYNCYVKDYSSQLNSGTEVFFNSKAVIRIYNNNELTHTFYIPKKMYSNTWNVFQICKGEVTLQKCK